MFCPVCELAHSYYSFHHNRRIGSTNLVEDICEAYSHEVCLCQGDNDVISGGSIIVPGVHIRVNFLDTVQESAVVNHIEQYPWKVSQSGRLKQVSFISFDKGRDHLFILKYWFLCCSKKLTHVPAN